MALSIIAVCQGSPKKCNTITWSATIISQQRINIILNRFMDNGELDIINYARFNCS